MPKEVVRGDDHDNTDLVIKWTPDVYAQVGVETSDHRALVDWLYADSELSIGHNLVHRLVTEKVMEPVDSKDSDAQDEYLKRLGRYALDAVTGSKAGDFNSAWVNPSRGGWNQLIKAARRARNAVYGADE